MLEQLLSGGKALHWRWRLIVRCGRGIVDWAFKVLEVWCHPEIRQLDVFEPKDEVPIKLLLVINLGESTQIHLLNSFIAFTDPERALHSGSQRLWKH